jgi:hypothetical protein
MGGFFEILALITKSCPALLNERLLDNKISFIEQSNSNIARGTRSLLRYTQPLIGKGAFFNKRAGLHNVSQCMGNAWIINLESQIPLYPSQKQ